MAYFKQSRAMLSVLGAATVMIFTVQCEKDNVIAPTISRSLITQPDSTVFSPFYDSTVVQGADATPDRNDYAVTSGVLSIIKTNCSSTACHGGGVEPTLLTYSSVKAMVVPGNPEASTLYDLVTTDDLDKAMPPITYGTDLSVMEKTKIYNWIKNGAKEKPDLVDYRPAAMQLMISGCGSANCHNQATVGGEWARAKLINVTPSDTFTFIYKNPTTGAWTYYAQLKEPKLSQEWNLYKDSARKFYADTVANASFRPYKTFGAPLQAASRRGPLNSYDDIIFDIFYPKGLRTGSTVIYTDPISGKKFYVRGDPYNSTSSMLSRVDSTILLANPRTGVWNANHQGDMAYGDGGLKPGEIGIIKAWYFGDPNIPDSWKYGLTNAGIFKFRKSGNVVTKK
jgi:Planctomycete cytochrome C